MISRLAQRIREYRKRRHLAGLVQRGLRLGRNVQIEGDVFLDPSHCFLISIGDNCVLAPNVAIVAHDASMYSYLGVTKIQTVSIKENSFVGESVCILPGVTIGPNAVVGARSVVTKDIPPHSVAAGNPARVLCGLDEFLSRHRQGQQSYRAFPEERYRMGVVDAGGRKEILDYLAENRQAYMEGVTPDTSIFNRKS